MDTDSSYLALAEEKKDDYNYLGRGLIKFKFVGDCRNGFMVGSTQIFFPRKFCIHIFFVSKVYTDFIE